jgi:hypothetical protein
MIRFLRILKIFPDTAEPHSMHERMDIHIARPCSRKNSLLIKCINMKLLAEFVDIEDALEEKCNPWLKRKTLLHLSLSLGQCNMSGL